MTKEELEKEAEEYAKNNGIQSIQVGCFFGYEEEVKELKIKAYLASAEPREKQIAELEAQIERLKGDLELWESGACRATNLDKCGVVKELEAQIDKMKCCANCDNCECYRLGSAYIHCKLGTGKCMNYNKWRLKKNAKNN